MSEELINHYKADERELEFLLFEQFKIQDILEGEKHKDMTADDIRMIAAEAYKFATREIGPLNSYGDRIGCTHDPATGDVKTPPLMREMNKKFIENGWHLLRTTPEFGGQGLPMSASLVISEYFTGASAAWMMYSGLTLGAAHLIDSFGTPEQRALYCPKMYSHEWMGTMCLTEPGAGSEVGKSSSRATKNPDGTYNVVGVKSFISGGEHDLAENIIHMVLARVEGAAEGTAGLSLFIIPKFLPNPDGSVGPRNDMICRGIEHKMGINASATCTLNFGDNGKCVGFLLGTEENKGIKAMFQMMNEARIGTGMQALASASSAYLNAVSYSRTRVQGKLFTDVAMRKNDGPSVAIIEHEDIRRMLLEMKSKVEGMRMLALKLAVHLDRAELNKGNKAVVDKEMGYVELLTPLVKAYLSDQGFKVAELAIQTYGGYGYIQDYPVEQYCRDIKIQSLYEGTNYIQSLDLVGRKLNQNQGAAMRQYGADVVEFVKKHGDHPSLGADVKKLQEAVNAVTATTMSFMKFFQTGQLRQIPLVSTRFLEMLAETTLAWLLLDAAITAHEKLQGLAAGDRDHGFYMGKIHSAKFFVRNILPGVKMKADVIAAGDTSGIDITPDQFPAVGMD